MIREARPEDLDVIVEFNARLAHETEGKLLDRRVLTRGVEVALADPDRLRYWVAEVEPENGDVSPPWVIGQAAITREWSDWRSGWIWWYQSVYVHNDYRGQGAFRALYDHIRARAQATKDVIGIRLYVEVSNDRARRVYQSIGMKPGGYEVFEDLWLASQAAPGRSARSRSDGSP